MRALALVMATLALHAPNASAQESRGIAPEPRDTARVGESIHLKTSPAGPWRTLRFLAAESDSVYVGGSGGWLRTGMARASIERLQVMRPSLHGAAVGAGVGAGLGATVVALIWLPLSASASFDLTTGEAVPIGLATIAVPAAIGALLGRGAQPRVWRDGVLPAGRVPESQATGGVPPVTTYLFAGPDVDSGRLEDLQRRLTVAGVRLDGLVSLPEPWPAPTEVRHFDERDADAAEALAFWLARALGQPTLTRLQRDPTVPRGELQVRLAR